MEAARELCEFVVERVAVQQQQIGWLIGKSGSNFKELHGDPNPNPNPTLALTLALTLTLTLSRSRTYRARRGSRGSTSTTPHRRSRC